IGVGTNDPEPASSSIDLTLSSPVVLQHLTQMTMALADDLLFDALRFPLVADPSFWSCRIDKMEQMFTACPVLESMTAFYSSLAFGSACPSHNLKFIQLVSTQISASDLAKLLAASNVQITALVQNHSAASTRLLLPALAAVHLPGLKALTISS